MIMLKRTCGDIILASRKKGEHIVILSDHDGFYLQRVFNASERTYTYVSYDPQNKTAWQNCALYDHESLNLVKSQFLNYGYKIDWNAFNLLLLQKRLSWCEYD